MTRIPIISGYEMVKILSKYGWYPVRQTGSHCIMKKTGIPIRIVIPQHKELRPGIIHQIMKEAEITIDQMKGL